MISLDRLIEMIRLGEDSATEFKEARFSGTKMVAPSREHLARELAAMANAKGGWLILGIEDKSRRVVGLPVDRLDAAVRFVEEVCHDAIKPALLIACFRREVPDETGRPVPVLAIHVDQSPYVHQTSEGYFYRVGTSARAMQADFVLRLHQERSLTRIRRFEELPVPQSDIDSLDPALWQRFVSKRETDIPTALLKRNLLARDAEGDLHASVLGLLMCSTEPRRFIPNAFIQAVRYRGTLQDSNFQIDAKEFAGPLDRQILDAFDFFKLNHRIGATKETQRTDQPAFSTRAVFEAIVNAVAHRDYSIDHSKIRFFMFDDRIELYSPGSLVNSMSVESLRLRTATRNERITNLLSECPIPSGNDQLDRDSLMERRGDGVDIILDESLQLSGRSPVYHLIDDAELLLTMYAAGEEGAPQ
jgi:predicted HTH transcriptional regulator